MSDLKSILLHLDASPRSAVRLRLAAALAAQHGATVTAAYAATSAMMTAALAAGEGSGLLLSAAADIDAERRQRARAMFDEARLGAQVEWTELTDPVVAHGIARAGLVRDLIVVGQAERDEADQRMVPADFAESVIVQSGKPTLVVPFAGNFTQVGRTAVIAWKATRESARAVTAALPLLKRAEEVHVASWGDDPAELVPFLRAHGVEARCHREPGASGGDVGELLLSRACDFNADLLVLGCYGHSRAREFVLGGVTRTVLESMTVPVLMVH